jgi:hypothetical protein
MKLVVFLMGAALVCVACNRDASRDARPTDSAVAAPQAQTSQPPAKANHVALQYDSLPTNFTLRAGALIPGSSYDLSYVVTPAGDEVWLDTLGARVGGRRARTVRAQLKVPPLARDERLFMASCDVNGKLDPTVVAIVVNQPNATRFTQIRQAWRANVAQSRFDVIAVTGVSCEDPGA